MAYNRLIGNVGEDIACEWLKKHNFLIIERNYNKKWGEIDIIATKDKILQFIEVKSVTIKGVQDGKGHRPEENVHETKVRRLKRVIQTYLLERRYGLDTEFIFHVLLVHMNQSTRRAKVIMLENIIL
ncbi:MAG: YraN family protein [bacterium]|nr:YraN family protein [bacterium]